MSAQPGILAPTPREARFLTFRLEPGAAVRVSLPDGHNAFAYVYEGSAEVAGRRLERGTIAVLTADGAVSLASGQGARLILVAGKPLREPVAKYGPFVMNTEAELRQAFVDYQLGKF